MNPLEVGTITSMKCKLDPVVALGQLLSYDLSSPFSSQMKSSPAALQTMK